MTSVIRTILIAGLLLLAVLMPLAALPGAANAVAALLALSLATAFVRHRPRSVDRVSFAGVRAPPPSR